MAKIILLVDKGSPKTKCPTGVMEKMNGLGSIEMGGKNGHRPEREKDLSNAVGSLKKV